jgi:proline iminopeptidase
LRKDGRRMLLPVRSKLRFATFHPSLRKHPDRCKQFLMTIRYLILFASFFFAGDLAAQRTDSIKYDYGFLYYHDYGKGEPIILLSGGPGNNCSQLSEMATELAKTYRVILLEQRGTGLSIPKPLDSTTVNLKTAVDDLKLLLDKLNLKKAIICGHSWGGSLAMYFATAYPSKIKSLILIDPGFFSLGKELTDDFYNNRSARWSIGEKKLIDSLTKKRDENVITNDELYILKYTQRLPYVSKKERLDTLYKKIDAPTSLYMQTLLFKEAAKSKIDFRQSLKNLNKPVSVICGRQDFLSNVSYELKINYPKYYLYWIEDSGHFPMYEQPEQFYSILRTVIDKVK